MFFMDIKQTYTSWLFREFPKTKSAKLEMLESVLEYAIEENYSFDIVNLIKADIETVKSGNRLSTDASYRR